MPGGQNNRKNPGNKAPGQTKPAGIYKKLRTKDWQGLFSCEVTEAAG